MQEPQNLWPSNLGDIQKSTPVEILAKQADFFNAMMQNVLEANIISRIQEGHWSESAQIAHDLRIKAPSLSNYTLTILSIYHDPVKLYPVRIEDKIRSYEQIPAEKWINTEDEITDTLKGIFGSKEMNETVSSLLAQAKYSGSAAY